MSSPTIRPPKPIRGPYPRLKTLHRIEVILRRAAAKDEGPLPLAEIKRRMDVNSIPHSTLGPGVRGRTRAVSPCHGGPSSRRDVDALRGPDVLVAQRTREALGGGRVGRTEGGRHRGPRRRGGLPGDAPRPTAEAPRPLQTASSRTVPGRPSPAGSHPEDLSRTAKPLPSRTPGRLEGPVYGGESSDSWIAGPNRLDRRASKVRSALRLLMVITHCEASVSPSSSP